MKEYGEKIPAEKKSVIESALTELKTAHASRDFSAIDAALEKLNAGWQAASQDMYNASGGQNPTDNAGGPQAEANKSADGEVTDVDFEEVKEDKK